MTEKLTAHDRRWKAFQATGNLASAGVKPSDIIRRHIHHPFSYAVSTLHWINESYGTIMLIRVTKLLHRLNIMRGLTPTYYPAHTVWNRVPA